MMRMLPISVLGRVVSESGGVFRLPGGDSYIVGYRWDGRG